MKFLQSICVLFITTVYQYVQLYPDSPLNNDFLTLAYNICLRSIVAFTDLFNISTILYLFYFQGRKFISITKTSPSSDQLNKLLHTVRNSDKQNEEENKKLSVNETLSNDEEAKMDKSLKNNNNMKMEIDNDLESHNSSMIAYDSYDSTNLE